MPETSFWLLSLATACLFIMTLAILMIAGDLRLALRRLNAMLPEAAQAVHDARRVFRLGRRLLARADVAAGHVQGVIHQACDAATDALGAIGRVQTRTQMFWAKRFGNGAGAEPRRHHRRR